MYRNNIAATTTSFISAVSDAEETETASDTTKCKFNRTPFDLPSYKAKLHTHARQKLLRGVWFRRCSNRNRETVSSDVDGGFSGSVHHHLPCFPSNLVHYTVSEREREGDSIVSKVHVYTDSCTTFQSAVIEFRNTVGVDDKKRRQNRNTLGIFDPKRAAKRIIYGNNLNITHMDLRTSNVRC